MMSQRAHALLARTAFNVDLQVDRFGVERFTAGNVRGTEECDDGNTKRRRKVPRTRIGGDQQGSVLDSGLRQPQTRSNLGQADNTPMPGTTSDGARFVPFVRTA